MKKLIYLFAFIIVNITLLSKDVPFKAERMITDFNGVVTNGNNTIAYGNYGIMTYSFDMGQTWKQHNIGDGHSIKKIITVEDDFIGITNLSFIKSTDNGMTWTMNDFSDEEKLINFTAVDNLLYILTNNSILKSDFNLSVQSEPVFELEENTEYSELKSDGKNLYFIKNGRLLQIYDIETDKLTSVNLIDEMDCSSCTSINDIQTSDKMVYVKMIKTSSGINFPYVLSSSDNGKTWQNTELLIRPNAAYKIVNNKIQYFTPIRPESPFNSGYYINGFYRVDSIDIELDTNYITRINTEEKIERRTKTIEYTDFAVSGNNIIAVGNSKLISVSSNGGKTFEFKSHLKNTYRSEHQVNILSDSLMYFIFGHEFYKSTDGGVTWLPQIFTDYNSTIWIIAPYFSYVDKNGNGFANYRAFSPNSDSNAIVTYDGGENFIRTNNPEFNLPHSENDHYVSKGIDLGNKFIIIREPAPFSIEKKVYTFFRYDKSLNLLDSIELDVSNIVNLTNTEDNHLLALILEESGENKADEEGNTEDYKYEYKLIKSTDQAATWNTIYNSVPITQPLYKYPGSDYYKYRQVVMEKSVLFNNYILYPTMDRKIYRYDIDKNEFDSIPFPGLYYSGNVDFPLFKFDDKLISISNREKQLIYITEFDEYGNVEWDSLEAGKFFEVWNQFDYSPFVGEGIQNVIFLTRMTSNKSGYLITGQTEDGDDFEANIVKIGKEETTSVEEVSTVENQRAYLWNSLPYPIPGISVIESRVYCNGAYSLTDLKIKVLNMNGEQLLEPQIIINSTSNYSGVLTWDCTNVPSGVYIIQLQLNGENLNIPVVVAK